MGVWLLQRLTLPCWPDFLVLVVWTATMWSYFYYFLVRLSAREFDFCWYLPQNLQWNKYPWGQYSLVHYFMSCVVQDISNLWVLWLTSSMELWKIHHQTPHEIEVRHNQFLGLGPELIILHEIVSVQDISLHRRGVNTWVAQIYFCAILYPRHKLDIPMRGNFKSNICCCDWKLLHGINTIIIHLEYIELLCKIIKFIGT